MTRLVWDWTAKEPGVLKVRGTYYPAGALEPVTPDDVIMMESPLGLEEERSRILVGQALRHELAHRAILRRYPPNQPTMDSLSSHDAELHRLLAEYAANYLADYPGNYQTHVSMKELDQEAKRLGLPPKQLRELKAAARYMAGLG